MDDEGEVLEEIMQPYRDTVSALRLFKALIMDQPVFPASITTEGLRSYGLALRILGMDDLHRFGGRRANNRLFRSEAQMVWMDVTAEARNGFRKT